MNAWIDKLIDTGRAAAAACWLADVRPIQFADNTAQFAYMLRGPGGVMLKGSGWLCDYEGGGYGAGYQSRSASGDGHHHQYAGAGYGDCIGAGCGSGRNP